jgi:hypothetical protein
MTFEAFNTHILFDSLIVNLECVKRSKVINLFTTSAKYPNIKYNFFFFVIYIFIFYKETSYRDIVFT